jgi:hypothetical protein
MKTQVNKLKQIFGSANVLDVTDGNCPTTIVEVRNKEGFKHVIVFPNSLNDNEENEEYNQFEVFVLEDSEEADDILTQQKFDRLEEAAYFILY